MNSTTKRVFLWILALVMALSVFVFTACQQTTEPVFVLNEAGTGYWLKKSGSFVAERLEIPSTYQGLPVLGVKDSAFKNSKNLKEISIIGNDDSETFTIGLGSFKGCKSLQKVEIDGFDVVVIDNSAFSKCKNLQTVTVTNAEKVKVELYAFEYIDDITLNITGAEVDIESSVFLRDEDQIATLNLTNCTGETESGANNVNLVNCVLNQFEGGATHLLLDNTKLLDDEMYLYVTNATFRGTVVYHNNYKSGFFGKGQILTNLTIESIGPGSSYSQVSKDEYYPLAKNITIGSAVTNIPAGIFGNGSLAELLKDDTITLNIAYQGASSTFDVIPYDTLNNGNLSESNYTLTSLDGQPCTITFVDDKGQVVATMQGEVGGNLYNQGLSLPNATMVPGRLINGYYKDAERTIVWKEFGNLIGDEIAYLSFVDDQLLTQAEMQLQQGSSINFDNNVYSVTTNVNVSIWLSTLQNEFIFSAYATAEYFSDEQCATPALTEFDQVGEHNVYIKVTSWDKSQTNVYLLKVIVKDIYTVTFQVDGSTFDTQSCVEGNMLATFPSNPYKKGHTFVGWSTDGTEQGIVADASAYYPTSNITLTAVFSKDVYTLTVNDTDLSYQVSYGDSVVLPYPQQKQYYTISGYKYNGNVLSTTELEDGYSFVYNFEQSIQVEPNYVAKTYTITLDSNEHNDKYINYTVESNDFYLPSVSRDWYAFVAWYTQENGQGEQVSLIETSAPKDIKLYAYFTLANYTVSFKDGSNVVYSQKFNYENQTINVPQVPQKAGYNTSWQQFTISARSFDVQLVCDPIVYNITYNETFGLPNGNPDVYTVEDTLQLVKLQRTHYDFLGWQDEQGNLLSQIKVGTTGDLTLTAQWAVTKYALNFYTDENTYTTERVQYGSTFNIDTLPTPTAKDKLFVGWYDSEQYTNAISGNVTVMGNTNVYAKWMDSTAIASAEDFEKIRENPSGTFHLTNDVDMTGNLVSPIAEFSGTLDGFGYKLYNFTLKINAQLNNFGLFATNSGTIRNLNLEEIICSVTTNPANSGEVDNIGVLVGVNQGSVIHCNVSSPSFTVTTNFGRSHFDYHINIGGLAGKNQGSLTNCQANVVFTASLYPYNNDGYYHHYSVNLYTRIGGLVGVNSGSILSGSSISSFTVTGNAHGSTNNGANNYVYIGGLVGINDSAKTIEKSFATATVNSSITHGNVASGSSYTGGFIAINNGIIRESYANGSISAYSANTNDIGGFAGQVGANGDISNCYTSASVTGNGGSSIGGFVGYLAGSVQNCYAGGDVLVSNSSSNVGGFVGLIGSGGIANKSFTTNNVTANASKAGFFCANDSDGTSIVVNSYYSASACVSNNGSQLDRADESGAKRDYLSNIINQQFLQSKMYFYEEQWIFTTGVPVLRWEVQTDGSTLTNGSYYLCASCGEQFVNDNSASATIYNDTAETCVTDGIRYFGCSNCNKHFAVITQPATGHSFTDDSAGKDFCNDNVLVTYTCKNSGCGYTYQQQFLATEHQHNHTDSCVDCGYILLPSTCTTAGSLTFVCDDCGQSVTKVIPAEHDWQFISWGTQPTCTDNGWGNFCCSVCDPTNTTPILMEVANSKLGHLDTSGDGLCDRDNCDALIYDATNAVQIATVSDLLAINLDISSGSMEKTYILTADIDLKDVAWNPIGTKSNPFTGVLLGNGHKISNVPLLCSDETLYYGGLFGYNQGIITQLTVHFNHVDSFYQVCLNRDIVYGGICAYNNGTINQCTISGTASMHFLTYALNNTKGGSASASQNVTFGLVAGENNGFIVGTTVSANYSFVYENYAYLGQDINHAEVGLWTSGDYQRMYVTTTQTVTAGVICGKNSMNITNCSITGAGNVYNYLAMSQFMKGKYGTLTATSTQSLGAFAGNQNLDNKQGNTLTGKLEYMNTAGTHTPANGNDPGNSFYSMSSSTAIAIYQ